MSTSLRNKIQLSSLSSMFPLSYGFFFNCFHIYIYPMFNREYVSTLSDFNCFLCSVTYFKGIVSWDIDGLFIILSYSLDVGHLPLGILFFLILCFHIYILSFCLKVYHVWQKSSRGIVWKFCNQIRVTTQTEKIIYNIILIWKHQNWKKRMSSGSSLTSKLHDKIIKMLSKSHETIPLNVISCFYVEILKRNVLRLEQS
jgi:hypothetical protein